MISKILVTVPTGELSVSKPGPRIHMENKDDKVTESAKLLNGRFVTIKVNV